MSTYGGRNYIVTGATGTLGQHIVSLLVKRGERVFLIARGQQNLDRLRQVLHRDDRVTTFSGDLTNPDVARYAASMAVDQFTEIHGLIHLVGQFFMGAVGNTPVEHYMRLFQSNVISAVNITQPVLAHLADGASLVYTSSFLAHDPMQGMSAYAASKAALVAWSRALAREVRPHARVNIVSTTTLASPEAQARFQGKAKVRLMNPEQVAHTVVMLTMPEMASINGAVIPVYGNFCLEDPSFL
jgi:NAD(P)-dependent dehydrogenase (short-subunit alcohol dehydrogenase family)